MKKLILLFLMIILSGLTILYGKLEYEKRLNNMNIQAQAEIEKYDEIQAEQKRQEDFERQKRLDELTHNLPKELQKKITEAFHTKEIIKVVAMGSRALVGEENAVPWPDLVEQQVNVHYGQNVLDVITLSYGLDNTFDIFRNNKHLELVELKPDILLLEPFILNNTGYAKVQDTLYHIGELIKVAKQENEDIVIFIQPPNPIIDTPAYQDQVEQVKKYCLENEIYYFDHWKAWPKSSEKELQNYLIENDNIPNQEGHQLWADYIVNYFASVD
jgi:hypothetical protein